MIDFPSSPTVGQQFTSGGVTWAWDGAKWTSAGISASFLPLAGGTMTGDLIINAPNNQGLTINGPSGAWNGIELNAKSAGQGNWIGGYVNNKERWEIDIGNAIAETGSNSGSDFQITRFNDAGTQIDNPLVITRTDGVVYVNKGLSAQQAIGDNRIINGDMRIDQRNNGAAGTANGYTVDRWQYQGSVASKLTWGRNYSSISGPAAFPYCLGAMNSAATYAPASGDYFEYYQIIEADMVSDFAWGTPSAQPVTLSFLAYTNVALSGSFSGSITNGATTRSYPFSFSIPTIGVWTKIVITIPGDTAGTWALSGNAAGLRVVFDLGSGSSYRGLANVWASAFYLGVTGAANIQSAANAGLWVTGVKLEVGSVATPFNRQSLAKSLADCQRYYEVITNGGGVGGTAPAAGANSRVHWWYKVQKRATPTMSLIGISGSLDTSTIDMVQIVNNGAAAYFAAGNSASAEL